MMSTGGYRVVAEEVARRLRANDHRGDEAKLRETAASVIEQLLDQKEAMARMLRKYQEGT